MKIWVCEKCNWEGKRPATMGVPGIKVKVCQQCLSNQIHQEDRKVVKQA